MFQYLAAVHLNDQRLPETSYEVRDGKLWLDATLKNDDSILFVSTDDSRWPSRRVYVGHGGNADLYLHPSMFGKQLLTEPAPLEGDRPELVEAVDALELSPPTKQAILDMEKEVRGSYEDQIKELEERLKWYESNR